MQNLGKGDGLPSIAVALGATSPDPGYVCLAYSSTLARVVLWNGTSWQPAYGVTVAATPQTSPAEGDGFYDTDDLRRSIRYSSAWVEEARGVTGAAFDLDGGDSSVNRTQNNLFDFGASA